MKLQYNKIRKMDISNGPGVRVSLFTQGCFHHCKECFNEETWDFTGGKEWTDDTNKTILSLMGKDYIKGFSILGGDLFCYYGRIEEIEHDYALDLVREIKNRYSEKTIWLWTGYTWEELSSLKKKKSFCELLQFIDVIVDGRFEVEKKDPRLKYAGSTNQRVIDVKQSEEKNEIILYEEK